MSRWELTDTNSPAAIDIAPALSAATPAVATALRPAPDAATPIATLATDRIPSLAPALPPPSGAVTEMLLSVRGARCHGQSGRDRQRPTPERGPATIACSTRPSELVHCPSISKTCAQSPPASSG